ncbi:DUF3010 family protein [Crocinitomix algicola]|uniref:DUF3010 family protein n=1 Tax=Crocinitomix algicola TaxID=1740263 RepID=UPI0008723C25|nr:DUF3010 family protein [Crocinitomix algicola]
MKTLGIEIKGRKVIIVALEKVGGVITDITGTYKPIELENDTEAQNLRMFKDTLLACFDNFSPDAIVIKYRNPKGKGDRAPSPISFKIEGIIQLYEHCPILMVFPQTISAYFKKNRISLNAKYTYQNDALKYAYYYLSNN